MIIGDFNIDIICGDKISHEFLDNVTIKQVNNRLNNFFNYKILLNKANLTEWNSILSIQDPNGAVNTLIR